MTWWLASGKAPILLVAGLVHGAEVALVAANQSVSGSDLVTIRAKDLPPRERLRGRPELSRSDGAALADSAMGQNRLAHTESSQEVRAENGGKKKSARIVSGTPGSIELFRLEVAQGRYIDEDDMHNGKRHRNFILRLKQTGRVFSQLHFFEFHNQMRNLICRGE